MTEIVEVFFFNLKIIFLLNVISFSRGQARIKKVIELVSVSG